MTYLSTTRGSLMRTTTASDHGDPVDDNTAPVVGSSNAPVSLIEKSKRVQDPDSMTWREVRYLEARVPSTWHPMAGDRVRDDRTGLIYSIVSGTRVPRSLAGLASLTLELSITQ